MGDLYRRGNCLVCAEWVSDRVTLEWMELYFSNPQKVKLSRNSSVTVTCHPGENRVLVEFDNATGVEIKELCSREHTIDNQPMNVTPWSGTKSDFLEGHRDRLSTKFSSKAFVQSKVEWKREFSDSEEPFVALMKKNKANWKNISINTVTRVISVYGTSKEVGSTKARIAEYFEKVGILSKTHTIQPAVSAILRKAGGEHFLECLLQKEDITAVVRLRPTRLEVFVDTDDDEGEMAITHILNRKLVTEILPVKEGLSPSLSGLLHLLQSSNVYADVKGPKHAPSLHIQGLRKDVCKAMSAVEERLSEVLRESSPSDIDAITGAMNGLRITDLPASHRPHQNEPSETAVSEQTRILHMENLPSTDTLICDDDINAAETDAVSTERAASTSTFTDGGKVNQRETAGVGVTRIKERLQLSMVRFIEMHLQQQITDLREFFREFGGHLKLCMEDNSILFSFPSNHETAHSSVKKLLDSLATDICRMINHGSYAVLTSPEGRCRVEQLEADKPCAIDVSTYQGPGWRTDTRPPENPQDTTVTPSRPDGKKSVGRGKTGRPGRIPTSKNKPSTSTTKSTARETKGSLCDEREYTLGRVKLVITRDSVTKSKAEILVNTVDRSLRLDGKLAKTFISAAGKDLTEAIRKHFPCDGKDLLVTKGFGIPACRFIYHAVVPTRVKHNGSEVVSTVVTEVLSLANSYSSVSVAFPTLRCGPLNIRLPSMSDGFFSGLVSFLMDNEIKLKVIKLCVPFANHFKVVRQYFDEKIPHAQSFLNEMEQAKTSQSGPLSHLTAAGLTAAAAAASAVGCLSVGGSGSDDTDDLETKESFMEGDSYRLTSFPGATCQITAHSRSDVRDVKSRLEAIVRDLLVDNVVPLPVEFCDEYAQKELFKFTVQQSVIGLPDLSTRRVRLVGSRAAVERIEEFMKRGPPATSAMRETSV